MKRYIKGMIPAVAAMFMIAASANSWAVISTFSVTPRVHAPTQLLKNETGTAIYQVTNNTNYTLTNMGVVNLPTGVTVMDNQGDDYCPTSPFTLAANSSCLLKLKIVDNDSNAGTTIQGGPKICYSVSNPVYCSQPLSQDQLNIQLSTTDISTNTCSANASNFDNELQSSFQSVPATTLWGPLPSTSFSYGADVASCATSGSAEDILAWKRQRILAAADFWINQKLNYCHHYLPDWMTPAGQRQTTDNSVAGYCNPAVDMAPGTPYYNQMVRWNYSGTGSETAENWQNNNYMWYGMDCSNYTRFLYNFALGIHFTGDVQVQAGQSINGMESPNANPSEINRTPGATSVPPGYLLCADGTADQGPTNYCNSHGGYFSVIDGSGHETLTITNTMLGALKPGDLLYIAASLSSGVFSPKVTHVIMWTGKQVGNGPNDIPASKIAPDPICPSNWQPQTGDWVITDSHYQGADYRVFTNCFYRNHVWGVRRVIV